MTKGSDFIALIDNVLVLMMIDHFYRRVKLEARDATDGGHVMSGFGRWTFDRGRNKQIVNDGGKAFANDQVKAWLY